MGRHESVEVDGVADLVDDGLDVGGEGGHDRSLSALWRSALCFLLVITTITHSVTFSSRRRVAP